MKFTALFALGLASAALATPTKVAREPSLIERDSSPTSVLAAISAKVSDLASAVSAYSGGDPSAVQSASDAVITVTNSGVATIKSGADLTNADALALTSPVQDLTTQIKGVVSDLIDKKSKFEAACAAGQVLTSLNDQYTAASNLAKVLSAKVPSALSSIAEELSSGITAGIQKGIDAYKGASDSGCSTSTSTASASGTATTESETATSTTGSATTTATTSSSPVIPTGSSSASGSSNPTSTPTGSSTSSAASSSFTGAANKERFSYAAGALAAVVVAVAI
ncbi:hypothetical protein P175DRAFT_0533328 [Aspergillus ochraceoroseus IBT 24754]|uniref:Cell wall mannoprotein 1 n=2 Tax=Aspergillus subgen. Nidulantes TaxID=2720870 RepID=A0A0F8UET3_9EURO|nr:uncharacterized protein P175DRAFT_0533328 [Aspergillus ochraceoroseus IBT 24754]KKK18224.1 hypothetical protein ARAM_002974 [Aspergillus rambellii]PTU20331.1 hypothetical protein P175DRAFT_0533328 [Aspergillus ochraceoroseus IBT 24754]